jgi:hypothetical protein
MVVLLLLLLRFEAAGRLYNAVWMRADWMIGWVKGWCGSRV